MKIFTKAMTDSWAKIEASRVEFELAIPRELLYHTRRGFNYLDLMTQIMWIRWCGLKGHPSMCDEPTTGGPMNVGQLMAELMNLNTNLPVARDGLEGEHSGMHPVYFASDVCGQFDTRDWDDKTNVVLIS